MSELAIQVKDLSKQYKLGVIGTGSFIEDLKVKFAKLRGKSLEDFTKIGDNNRSLEQSGHVWALQNINFEVKQGEVLGIIGKNGAGKSTLLKVLSKVTSPTKGEINYNGRIASLLEVGTGFHPELTGRQNIFLNGAILGMTKKEIESKLDEIIQFSGIGNYIDTPVKRYSSGMYVRLAFAVAAHLEPEIMIVDEVLAVGDAEFQEKCLGKMKEVSGKGRTVLFVSHNMDAIATLCDKAIMMEHGKLVASGSPHEMIKLYLKKEKNKTTNISFDIKDAPGDDFAKINSIKLIDQDKKQIDFGKVDQKIGIELQYTIFENNMGYKPEPNFLLSTEADEKIFQSIPSINTTFTKQGQHKVYFWFEANFLNNLEYALDIALTTANPVKIHASSKFYFSMHDNLNAVTRQNYKGKMHGTIRPIIKWEYEY